MIRLASVERRGHKGQGHYKPEQGRQAGGAPGDPGRASGYH